MQHLRLTNDGGAASQDGVSLHRALRYVEDHLSGHVDAPEGRSKLKALALVD